MGHRSTPGTGALRATLALCAVALLGTLSLAFAPSALAAPPLLWQAPPEGEQASGSGTGQMDSPRGIAADPATGHVYVADSSNERIEEFNAWGKFIRAWGWGVVASGPDNRPRNDIQKLSVDATAGSFELRLYNTARRPGARRQDTGPIRFDAAAETVQSALEGLRAIEPGEVSVSGATGGPWTIEFTGGRADEDVQPLVVVESTLSGGTATATVQLIQQGADYEVCEPAKGDVCRAGQGGSFGAGSISPGEFSAPHGLAVDAAGDVYVFDQRNAEDGHPSLRVQKFSPEGEFLVMFGGEVDKTTGANVCTKAGLGAGDECGAGVPGTANGFFSTRSVGNYIAYDATTDTIVVGDKERVQRFETDGTYKSQIDFEPSGPLAEFDEKEVGGLAVGPAGNLYLSFPSTDDVHEISADGSEVLRSFHVPAEALGAAMPVAVDGEGDVYAVDESIGVNFMREFDPEGNQLVPDAAEEEAKDLFPYIQFKGLVYTPVITALAVNRCAGSDAPGNLYLSFSNQAAASYVGAYGTPPIGCEPPPARPPVIAAQYATAAGADAATLQVQVNPLFWNDTTYQVEYGTGRCSEGGCPSRAPASPALLSERVTSEVLRSAGVPLTDLAPGTTYHYRFVAESGGGGPEYGPRPEGEEAVEGAASFAAGREGSFRTLSAPIGGSPCPANEALRRGLSAALPDCRAYELVSPLDKANGDAALLPPTKLAELNQSALSGEGFTYSSLTPYAEPEGSPFLSQYVARRDPGSGWSDEDISPPRTLTPLKGLGVGAALHNDFKAFSEDLCGSWLVHFSSSTLAGGALPGWVNLYRRRDCAGSPGYEVLTTTEPAGRPEYLYGSGLGVVGFSEDQALTAFLADGALTKDAPPLNEELASGGEAPRLQLYVQGPGGLRFACHLPSGSPVQSACAAGKAGPSPDNANDAKGSAVQGALSADGSRLYWTAYAGNAAGVGGELRGQIFLTRNPDAAPSTHLHGAAHGRGDLAGPAQAKCKLSKFTTTLTECSFESGAFAVGQEVTGPFIAAGTTITAVEAADGRLRLSQKPTESAGSSTVTGLPSAVVRNVIAEFGGFGEGQQITGPGIPAGTTIESCAPECGAGATSLTLSAPATQTLAGAPLDATSECTQPAAACTVPVSGPVAGEAKAEYWGASKDGSRAIFRITEGPLEGDVYEFDAATGASSLIAAGAVAPMGMSEDARRVYFASTALLGDGAAEGAEEGADNLYFYEAPAGGGAGSFSFIMRLATSDVEGTTPHPSAVNPVPTWRTSIVSPDGLHAAFGSLAPSPTGYDNADAESGERDEEVYRYDALAGDLACVSCNPSGARPHGGRAETTESIWVVARLAPRRVPLHAPRSLSEDGRRLFFESHDKLVPRDTNGTWDVYQWEAPGKGSCTTSRPTYNPDSGGCVDLISSGQTPSGARFLDADPSGDNVFIGTQASLISADYGLNDVYDARVNGGFPEPAGPPAGCEGEACQSPAAPPQAKTPASSAFHGPGDPAPGGSCGALASRAHRLATRARRLRRHAHAIARHTAHPHPLTAPRSRHLIRKSRRLARRAHGFAKRTKRCRYANRRTHR